MAEEDNATEEAPEKKGGAMKMVIFGVVGVALLGIGIFAGPAVKNMISPAEEMVAEGEEDGVMEEKGPPIYQSLHPPLVVNVKDDIGDTHFMQITMEVMSRDQEVINAVREHTPVIRNALILMFGTSMYESVSTREGKELMLDNALTEIQSVMTDRIGEPGIDEVYFTSLIVQ